MTFDPLDADHIFSMVSCRTHDITDGAAVRYSSFQGFKALLGARRTDYDVLYVQVISVCSVDSERCIVSTVVGNPLLGVLD